MRSVRIVFKVCRPRQMMGRPDAISIQCRASCNSLYNCSSSAACASDRKRTRHGNGLGSLQNIPVRINSFAIDQKTQALT